MENFPKPVAERAPEDERVENPMDGMHVEDVAGVNAPENAPIPEVPASETSENGVADGVDEKLEAEADDWLAGRKKPVAPSVESEAPLGEEADGAGEATTA